MAAINYVQLVISLLSLLILLGFVYGGYYAFQHYQQWLKILEDKLLQVAKDELPDIIEDALKKSSLGPYLVP